MENLLPPEQWISASGNPVFVVSFFTRKGTLQVPKFDTNVLSERYGQQDGFYTVSFGHGSCIVEEGDKMTFIADGRNVLESRGYRPAAEGSPPQPDVPNQ